MCVQPGLAEVARRNDRSFHDPFKQNHTRTCGQSSRGLKAGGSRGCGAVETAGWAATGPSRALLVLISALAALRYHFCSDTSNEGVWTDLIRMNVKKYKSALQVNTTVDWECLESVNEQKQCCCPKFLNTGIVIGKGNDYFKWLMLKVDVQAIGLLGYLVLPPFLSIFDLVFSYISKGVMKVI